ncbi:Hypothetical protein SRAE_1000220200 [Strongyloides ratti]|uniref:Uncharacterized protein n=1 Tax=Strongyloides ratti TaxID=34506 RepID=A0A090L295_STRRB|nr:Hypothetical protein SRAE_1000220200 [Strongyloides ratti]CEF63946.1 Hypothetical protein SRAE_1000220200 [Strongyloides ratti]
MEKRKYNKRHNVNRALNVEETERTKEKRVFAVTVQKRDSETLLDLHSRDIEWIQAADSTQKLDEVKHG